MDKTDLRELVFEVLRSESQTHLNSIIYQVGQLAEDYQRHDALKIHEIVWELLVQGVLAPGKNSLNLNLPFVHVTEYGEECLETDAILVRDPDRYLRHLNKTVDAPIDETVLAYVREGQLAFLAGCYLSTVVLLSLAAEQSFALIADALPDALPGNFSGAGRCTLSCFTALKEHLATLSLTDDLRREFSLSLDGLYALIGYSRDEQGRIAVARADRTTAQALLLLFPGQCRAVHRLIERLSAHQAL